ncbi:hypothetical protein PAHAL_3G337800 [Panicum hallii]|uniref:Uncharacterized protein n=1 Tax=Panicum hallii TaxID=206008 RepID=A0A2S3HDI7_9POAL|nr:hypothetical protein PAHAL_3G337800 [Panicum hallii]
MPASMLRPPQCRLDAGASSASVLLRTSTLPGMPSSTPPDLLCAGASMAAILHAGTPPVMHTSLHPRSSIWFHQSSTSIQLLCIARTETARTVYFYID